MQLIVTVLLLPLVSQTSGRVIGDFQLEVFNHTFQSLEPLVRRNKSLIFHLDTLTAIPSAKNSTFKPANVDLQQYLNISESEPYALVKLSEDMTQFHTYTWEINGTYELKKFETETGIHPVLQLQHAGPPFSSSDGIEIYLFYTDVSDKETIRLAEIVRNVTENAKKFCFDVGSVDFNYTLKKYPPSILIRSPLYKQLIELEPPIDFEFVQKVLEATTFTMAEKNTDNQNKV